MNAMQAAVKIVTDLLAARDYASVARVTAGRRLSADELHGAVEAYGKTLVPVPDEALEDMDVYPIEGRDPAAYAVDVDLWTAEEGRSDLTLSLELVDKFDGAYDISVTDLHML